MKSTATGKPHSTSSINFSITATEIWPERDDFGSEDISTEEEFMALREIFMANLPNVSPEAEFMTILEIFMASLLGTHWTREIISLLISQNDKLDDRVVAASFLEYETDLSIISDVASRRIYSTHLMSKYIPKHHLTNGGKIIHLVRDPKDVCVSAYNHYKRDLVVDLDITWEEFFNLWIDGKQSCYGNNTTCRFPEHPLFNPARRKISTVTKFDFMKKNKKDNSNERTVDEKGFIYRKGEIGDWKNWFTVSQSERFNKQYYDEMKDIEFGYVFE